MHDVYVHGVPRALLLWFHGLIILRFLRGLAASGTRKLQYGGVVRRGGGMSNCGWLQKRGARNADAGAEPRRADEEELEDVEGVTYPVSSVSVSVE